ncbi:MAG: sugar ABC transporter permease [Candidatus Bathyarchaeia archaeon]
MIRYLSTSISKTLRQLKRPVTLLALPAIAFLIFLVIYPTVYLWGMIFFSFHPARDPYPRFVGLENFRIILSDSECWDSLLRTLLVLSMSVPAQILLGILLALLFTSKYTRGSLLLRVLILIPMMIPSVIIGLNWKTILYSHGPFNEILKSLGLEPQPWLSAPFGHPSNTLICLALLDVWQWTPFVTLAMVSAFESIPKDVYEAADIDGAKGFKMFRFITLPMSKSTLVTILLLRVVDSLKIFDTVYSLTYGGPGSSTTTYPFYIFKTGFTLMSLYPSYGYTALLSLVLLGVATVLTTIIMRILKIEEIIWG